MIRKFCFAILLFIIVPSMLFAQQFINRTREEVKKEIKKLYFNKENITASLTETDSSLTLGVSGTGTLAADRIFRFDQSGKCKVEKIITRNDSCHEKILQQILAKKNYHWKKLNLNQYISVYSAGVFFEIQFSGDEHSITIFRTNLSKKMYRFLLDNN